MLSLLAGCGGKSTEQAPEEKPSGEQSVEEQTPEEGDDWYELDKETGVLTVRIPAEKPGYTWDFTINDESVLELLTCEETEGTFVASFRALQDGETEITFAYTKGSSLDHVRVLGVQCKDGKVVEDGAAVKADSSHASSFTYKWTKYNASGVATNWNGTSSAVSASTKPYVTVAAADVSGRGTFTCEVSK